MNPTSDPRSQDFTTRSATICRAEGKNTLTPCCEETILHWIEELGAEENERQIVAERALIRCGRSAVSYLIAALESPNTPRRFRAAWSLGVIRDPAGFPGLLSRALMDPDLFVRYESIMALGQYRGPRAIGVLFSIALHDEDDTLQSAAYMALRKYGAACIPYVRQLLNGATDNLAADLVYLLRSAGNREALELIRTITLRRNAYVWGEVCDQLLCLETPECRALLAELASDPNPALASIALYYLERLDEYLAEKRVRQETALARRAKRQQRS